MLTGLGDQGVLRCLIQRPHELRLAISTEAEGLIFCFGYKAYAEARRRAEEASSDFLARDWDEVAFVSRARRANLQEYRRRSLQEALDVGYSGISLVGWDQPLGPPLNQISDFRPADLPSRPAP